MKKALVCVIFLLCAMTNLVSEAADFPTKPIEILVGYPAGGSTDAIFRLVTPMASKLLGQPLVVVNKTGASGALAMISGAKARPDGYTLVMLTIAQPIQNATNPHAGFDSINDFTPICNLVTQPNILTVHASSKITSVAEYVEEAKKNPGKITICGSGLGSSPHFSGEMFKSMAGIDLTYIPHKGSAPCIEAILGKHIDSAFENGASVIPHVMAGKLRALAVSTPQRISELPNTPTIAESGYPGYEMFSWLGCGAPSGTPYFIVEKIANAFKQALQDSEVIEKMKPMGFKPAYMPPDKFKAYIKSECDKYKKLAKEANIKVE
jgi:tripartite-type tricarboxylate transporter receptor subunit TctC